MARRPAGRTAGMWWLPAILMAVWPSGHLIAQVAPNRATAYLHPSDVLDARAIWVNPAGLGVLREASVYAELAVAPVGARGRLRQVNAGFNARGLSFGYQRDIFDGDVRGHTYRLGLAGSNGRLAAGGAIAHYRGGGAHTSGWDVGITYAALSTLTVAAVAANLGRPVVRGLRQAVTYIPGATWRPLPAARFSAHARITTDSILAYAFGLTLRAGATRRWPLELIVRLDTDAGLRRGAFSVGLSLGAADRFGIVASTPGDLSAVDAGSVYGLATRQPVRR
ncbi:MAG: hypothetical protein ACREME_03720 [Gemmatimonadales bacterium]